MSPALNTIGSTSELTRHCARCPSHRDSGQGSRAQLALWAVDPFLAQELRHSEFFDQVAPRFYANRFLVWLEWSPLLSEIWVHDLMTGQNRRLWQATLPLAPVMAIGEGSGLHIALFTGPAVTAAGPTAPSSLIVLDLNRDSLEIKKQQFFVLRFGWNFDDFIPHFKSPSLEWSPWNRQFLLTRPDFAGLVRWDEDDAHLHAIDLIDPGTRCFEPKLGPEYLESL